MLLESYLTTIPKPSERPQKLVRLGFRQGTRVDIPWLDSRTASGITLRMGAPSDKKAIEALFDYSTDPPLRDKTLAVALKCYYQDRVVFHGPIQAPEFDYDGDVSIVAHDPTLRLKSAYLNVNDEATTDGVSIDGEGMLSLLASGQNTAPQDALDWPSLGIVPGVDSTTESDAVMKLKRGDQIFSSITDMADLILGPDFRIEPFETDPAELASSSDTASPNAAIPDDATTDWTIAVGSAGNIGGIRVGVWAEHADPQQVNISLVHPDGTVIRLYTGSKDKAASGTDFLGTNNTTGTLCFFTVNRGSIYRVATTYPHVGSFRSDKSLSTLFDKPAAGTWKLRIEDTAAGSTGTLKHWRIDFLLPPSAYARMNLSDKPVTDPLPDPVCTFNKGHGTNNARLFKVTPQGDLVRNQFIATSKLGTKIRVNNAARAEYGTYQGWESPGENWDLATLAAYADAQVDAYNRPVPRVELAPKDDTGQNRTLRYGVDFIEGDHVRAVGKKGRAYHDLIVRVMGVTLTQGKASVQTDLDVLATVGTASEVTNG